MFGKTVGKDISSKTVKDVARTFVRKYVHSRIGGFVRGEFQRTQELKGKRVKGGEGLRDMLHTKTTKTGKGKGGSSSDGDKGKGKGKSVRGGRGKGRGKSKGSTGKST